MECAFAKKKAFETCLILENMRRNQNIKLVLLTLADVISKLLSVTTCTSPRYNMYISALQPTTAWPSCGTGAATLRGVSNSVSITCIF